MIGELVPIRANSRAPAFSRHETKASWLAMLGFFCLAAGAVRAAELHIEGLSLPFFDDAGHLTHKMTAARGSAAGTLRRLEEVEIAYFAPTDPQHVVQRVTAAEAIWNEQAETLSGAGRVAVRTDTSELEGRGFDFALATSTLRIHHEFKMGNPEFVLTGDMATADLVIVKAGEDLKFRDIRRCVASGNLHFVAQRTSSTKLPFKEAYTDVAVYDGVARTITLPHPVRMEGADGKQGSTNSGVIRLGEREDQKKQP